MIITQTCALFLDAYRELNAKKLFWITMVLSSLVVIAFATLGIDQNGITFLWMRMGFIPITSDMIARDTFYKLLFTNLGIGFWLSWIATILALVSTAGIIPELVSGGSIELLLSKPISRLRLFLTKYLTGLLFVALQVFVFTLGSFLVIGFRGGSWEFGLFLAVPIVVLFFSYLFGICTLLGVLTRSTIASLLVTLLFWCMLFLLNMADGIMMQFRVQSELVVEERIERIEKMEANTVTLMTRQRARAGEDIEGWTPTDEEMLASNPFLGPERTALENDTETRRQLRFWGGLVIGLKTVLPKTSETIGLLERHLVDLSDLPDDQQPDTQEQDAALGGEEIQIDNEDLNRRLQEAFRERSIWWIAGTSVGFEFVCVGLATLIFVRRDF